MLEAESKCQATEAVSEPATEPFLARFGESDDPEESESGRFLLGASAPENSTLDWLWVSLTSESKCQATEAVSELALELRELPLNEPEPGNETRWRLLELAPLLASEPLLDLVDDRLDKASEIPLPAERDECRLLLRPLSLPLCEPSFDMGLPGL